MLLSLSTFFLECQIPVTHDEYSRADNEVSHTRVGMRGLSLMNFANRMGCSPQKRELKPVRAQGRPAARGGPHRRSLKPVRAPGRPAARGGPTIYERVVGLVEGACIVGPPLAGGLPDAVGGLLTRRGWPADAAWVACRRGVGGLPTRRGWPADAAWVACPTPSVACRRGVGGLRTQ